VLASIPLFSVFSREVDFLKLMEKGPFMLLSIMLCYYYYLVIYIRSIIVMLVVTIL
jgi:hypothetical protein